MHPARPTRERHAGGWKTEQLETREPVQFDRNWQCRPGSSTEHWGAQRRFQGSSTRGETYDSDPWPPRAARRIQQRQDASSASAAPWRNRVQHSEPPVTTVAARSTGLEVEEYSQRAMPPAQRWSTRESRRPWRWSESSYGDAATRWPHRQFAKAVRQPSSSNISQQAGTNQRARFVHESGDSGQSQHSFTTRYTCHDDDGYNGDEILSEQRRSWSPKRDVEQWRPSRGDDQFPQTIDRRAIRMSSAGDGGDAHVRIPDLRARRLTHRVEWVQGRQGSPAVTSSQEYQYRAIQEARAVASATTSINAQSGHSRIKKRKAVQDDIIIETGEYRFQNVRPPVAARRPSRQDNNRQPPDSDGDVGRSERHADSTMKRRSSVLGKRTARVTHDVEIDTGFPSREDFVNIKHEDAPPDRWESESQSPKNGKMKRYDKKQCQYVDGCDKRACESTLFCIAHGGGKRCQYPEGCGNGAEGSTWFCVAHGGGKRCQYPEGCDKSARGSTLLCKAHGGGKRCQFPEGCGKSALGSTLFCIAHGGGKRCQYLEGCSKGAEGSTVFCKAHGGGRRCQFPEGCGKSAQGSTLFCRAHCGGKRCQYAEGCDKSALGSTLFCVAHGGGKRCQYPEGGDKSARGSTLLCRAHGGGKRCQYPEGCDKSARGSTLFCVAHGGGKRCQYPEGCDKSGLGATLFCRAHGGGKRCQYPDGCGKGAEGSTLFCKAHGGGKRCQYPAGCDKSALGPTLFCIAHGGGKRCQHPDGCDKSAQRPTLFCKAHGGGKRCQYPEGCDKSAQGATLFCKAHGGGKRCQYPEGCGKSSAGSTLFCAAHGGGNRCGHSSGCNKHVRRGGMCKGHGVEAGLWN